MFTSEEKSLLQLKYFQPVFCASDACELISKNGDHWLLLKIQDHIPKKQLHNKRYFTHHYELFHRHSDAEGFHLQNEFVNLLDLILEIIAHDDFRLHQKNGAFEEVVSAYSDRIGHNE